MSSSLSTTVVNCGYLCTITCNHKSLFVHRAGCYFQIWHIVICRHCKSLFGEGASHYLKVCCYLETRQVVIWGHGMLFGDITSRHLET